MSLRFLAPRATTIADVLAEVGLEAPAATQAVVDGRVFLGRTRVLRLDLAVPAGAEVLVHATRDEVQLPEPFVLQQGNGLLVVDKPAGIPTVPDVVGAQGSLLDYAARALHRSRDELHPTSRLDRDVSGVVTFTLDDRATELLATAREEGRYERRYVAIAAGHLPETARWTWSIDRARDPRLRRAVNAPAGKSSATRMRVVARSMVSRWMRDCPRCVPHSMQLWTHASQPMHLLWSITNTGWSFGPYITRSRRAGRGPGCRPCRDGRPPSRRRPPTP